MRAIIASEMSVYHLLFKTVSLIVEHPDQLSIRTLPTADQVTFSVRGHPDDIARLKRDEDQIGRAIQTLVDAMVPKSDRHLINRNPPCHRRSYRFSSC